MIIFKNMYQLQFILQGMSLLNNMQQVFDRMHEFVLQYHLAVKATIWLSPWQQKPLGNWETIWWWECGGEYQPLLTCQFIISLYFSLNRVHCTSSVAHLLCLSVCVCVCSVCIRLISHSFSVSSMCCLWQIRCAPAHKLEAKCTVFGPCVQEVVKALLTEKSSSPLTRKVQSVCFPKSPFVPRQGLNPTALEVYWPPREREKATKKETESPSHWSHGSQCISVYFIWKVFHRDYSSRCPLQYWDKLIQLLSKHMYRLDMQTFFTSLLGQCISLLAWYILNHFLCITPHTHMQRAVCGVRQSHSNRFKYMLCWFCSTTQLHTAVITGGVELP